MITMRISQSFNISLGLAAAAFSGTAAFGQCLAHYQTIAGADANPSATYWACDLDDETSELAILGQGGRVFVGALDPMTQK